MKTLSAYLTIFFCSLLSSIAQDFNMTMLYDYRNSAPLKRIVNNGENISLIVGATTVMRSADNGENWEHLSQFGGLFIDNAVFFDKNNCIVIGQKIVSQSFVAYYSMDMGLTWKEAQYDTQIFGSSSADLSSLEIVYSLSGACIVGTGSGSIISSDDFGRTWRKTVSFDGTYRLTNNLVTQDMNTFHSFRETEYNRSTDNGKTWKNMPKVSATGNIVAAYINKNNIHVALNIPMEQKVLFLKSSDNGENWTERISVTSLENVTDISIIDSQTIIAFRSNSKFGFYLSKDNGETWFSYLDGQIPVQLNDVYFSDNNTAIVIGNRKSIFSVNLQNKIFDTVSLVKLQSSKYDIHVLRKKPDNTILFCDGETTSPCFSTDMGATWLQNDQIAGYAILTDIYYRTNSNGYAIMPEQLGMFYETNDGGKTWVSMDAKVGKSYKAPTTKGPNFSFIDEKTGIVVVKDKDNSTAILSTNDGGETWVESIDTNFTHYFAKLERHKTVDIVYAVSLPNENKASFTQEILLSTDFGKSWKRSPIADVLAIEDFHVFDDKNILVVGRSGKKDSSNHRRFFRTTDGGITWLHVLKDNVASFPRTIAVEQNICIVGCYEYDSVLVSTDYGFTWKARNIRPMQKLDQIRYTLTNSFIQNNTYYASGHVRSFFTPEPTSSPFIMKSPIPSGLTSIEEIENNDPFARVWIFDIAPNPVSNSTNVSIFCDPAVKQSLSIGLYTVQGILMRDLSTEAGITPTGHGKLSFDVAGMNSGMYLLKISAGGTTKTKLLAIIQ